MELGYLQDGEEVLNMYPRTMRAWNPIRSYLLTDGRSRVHGIKIVNLSAKAPMGAWAPIRSYLMTDGRAKAYGVNLKGSSGFKLKR